jgi:2-oxoglutarate dehydrogenase complex dehydrogenase (E1) component-like enzyme
MMIYHYDLHDFLRDNLHTGVEYMHMGSKEKCNWIRDQVENPKWMK